MVLQSTAGAPQASPVRKRWVRIVKENPKHRRCGTLLVIQVNELRGEQLFETLQQRSQAIGLREDDRDAERRGYGSPELLSV